MLDNRADYGDITIIYGARSHADLCYKDELKEWGERPDVELILTVDANSPGTPIREGFVPTVLNEVAPAPDNKVAITCGPPIMIKYVLQNLDEPGLQGRRHRHDAGSQDEVRHRSLRPLQHRAKYICKDGPVFSLKELKELQYEI